LCPGLPFAIARIRKEGPMTDRIMALVAGLSFYGFYLLLFTNE
jgi:hypothetical protein